MGVILIFISVTPTPIHPCKR